jgi:hypothetical protein
MYGDPDGPRAKANSLSLAQKQRIDHWALPSFQPDSYFIERMAHVTHYSGSDYPRGLINWYDCFSEK